MQALLALKPPLPNNRTERSELLGQHYDNDGILTHKATSKIIEALAISGAVFEDNTGDAG